MPMTTLAQRIKSKRAISLLYLGTFYALQIGRYTAITLSQDELRFPEALVFRIDKEIGDWFFKQAREKITKRVEYYARLMQAEYLTLTFSDTKSQWGSCSHENNLQFSWRLIMAPLGVLDYVVIHELAHTKEKNHSWKFWSHVRRVTPAYKQHMKWLHLHAKEFII